MPLREPKYKPNQAILKDFGNGKYRITMHSWLRTSGIEVDDDFRSSKGLVNDEKLDSSIQHTRSRIFELAYCNDWDYFTTFTIDKTKYDRYNLEVYHRSFRKWISNYNQKHGTSIRYLTIPEKHKDGAWHEHGFISGIPKEHLEPFTLRRKLPHYIRNKIKSGIVLYDWPAYREKFGFCDFEEIQSREAVSRYVTKYITKDLSKSVQKVNAHMYYCSKGLKRAYTMKRGTMAATIEPDYGNEFVGVKWVSCDGVQQSLMEKFLLSLIVD